MPVFPFKHLRGTWSKEKHFYDTRGWSVCQFKHLKDTWLEEKYIFEKMMGIFTAKAKNAFLFVPQREMQTSSWEESTSFIAKLNRTSLLLKIQPCRWQKNPLVGVCFPKWYGVTWEEMKNSFNILGVCSQWGLWFISSNCVMLPYKRHLCFFISQDADQIWSNQAWEEAEHVASTRLNNPNGKTSKTSQKQKWASAWGYLDCAF